MERMSYKITDLVTSNCTCEINGIWVPARAIPSSNLRHRLKDAWLVFTMKAEAVTWDATAKKETP